MYTVFRAMRLGSGLAELNEPLHSNHPIATLIILVRHQVREDGSGLIVASGLYVGCQRSHRLDSVRLQKILVVQVIEEDIQALLCVGDVLFVLSWGASFYALHICLEDLIDRTGCGWDMGAITRRILGRSWRGGSRRV
jgi:hypothetical protein